VPTVVQGSSVQRPEAPEQAAVVRVATVLRPALLEQRCLSDSEAVVEVVETPASTTRVRPRD